MRNINQGAVLAVRAIGGLHVVTLAWDFVPGQEAKRQNLLGFAIERTELDAGGAVFERFWLRGIKRFKLKDEGLPPGSPVPTSEHPVQSFQWGDYIADPKTTYRYRVVPVYGKPNLIELDEASATTVEITTEDEEGAEQAAGATRHDIHFNRGVAGSQAYARLFPNTKPDETKPESEQMKWLSRGLFEALTAFIGRAAGPDAADFKLRAMLYEFHYAPVGEAFGKAATAGADVQIRYEAQSYKAVNEAMIAAAGIGAQCNPQKSRDDKVGLPTLHWYANRMASAQRIMCMTFAFNFDAVFQTALDLPSDALRYLLFDKAIDTVVEADVTRTGNTVVAVGAKLEKGDLEHFLGEVLTGFNSNYYIHDKFILMDPLGDDPTVVTGTANFSGPSQAANDENMLVIRGNTRVADIYFGEFMRIFDHLYSRYIIGKLRAAGTLDPNAGYLKEKTDDWLASHFKVGGPKEKRRRFFMGA